MGHGGDDRAGAGAPRVVIIGGGFGGLLAARALRREFRKIRPEDARVLLFDGGAEPLASSGRRLSGIAAATLRGLGVELHMNTVVTDVDRDGLEARAKDGSTTRHPAGVVLWTAGPFRYRGFAGSVAWLFIHIAVRTGFRNRPPAGGAAGPAKQ